jgi:hypothetical protein
MTELIAIISAIITLMGLPAIPIDQSPVYRIKEVIYAQVTAYNTVEGQTDTTPCINASGNFICGRNDAVACPTWIPFYDRVYIRNRILQCLDRTAEKYNGRFDISFDKDIQGARDWGVKWEQVALLY